MKWLWLLLLIPAASATLGPDSFGYVQIGPDPAMEDFHDFSVLGGTIMAGAAADSGQTISFPGFTFDYYGLEKVGGMVAEDGFFMFGSVLGQTNAPVPIPNPSLPNDYVAPLWMDNDSDCLIPGDEGEPLVSGEVYADTIDLGPGLVYIASWEDMPYIFNGLCRGANDYQVKLFGGTDVIEFHYQDAATFEDLTRLDECAPATIGIEEGGGASVRGLQYDASVPVVPNSCSKTFSFTGTAMRYFVNNDTDAADQTEVTVANTPISFDLNISDDPKVFEVLSTTTGSLQFMPDTADGVQYWQAPVTYTPPADWTGTDTFTYKVNDGYNGDQIAKVTLIVDGPVTAVDDSYTTDYETALEISETALFSNDSDANGDTLVLDSYTNPSSGTLTHDEATFTYTPNDEFYGEDSFTYSVTDERASTETATVTITVNPPNFAPVAVADSYGVNKNTQLSVAASGVLGNDEDGNDDDLSAALVTTVSNGVLVLNSDGSFTYDPSLDFVGSDSFTYRAYDGLAYSAAVAVTITVSNDDVAPTAVADEVSTDEDTDKLIHVMGNDYDGNNHNFAIDSFAQPSNGAVALEGTKLRYTPPANWSGVTSFTYTIKDETDMTATATVTVTVLGVNDPPEGTNFEVTMYSDGVLDVAAPGVLTDASDAEGDGLSAQLEVGPAHGTLTLSTDGRYVYTPTPGYVGLDGFSFRIKDATDESIAYSVGITVDAKPNDPPVAVDDAFTINEDTLLHATFATLLDNDVDPEDSFTLLGFTPAASGLVVDHADGTWSYAPPSDWSGDDFFTYTIEDDNGQTSVGVVTVHVLPVADPPRVSFDINAPDGYSAGRPIHFASTSVPGDAALATWTWDLDPQAATGQTASHTYSHKKLYAVTLTVTDVDGLTSSLTQSFTITNFAPVADFQFSMDGAKTRLLSTTADDQGVAAHWNIAGQMYEGTLLTLDLTEGLYLVTLTVVDPHGVTDSTQQTIFVRVPEPEVLLATQGGGGASQQALGPLVSSNPPPATSFPSEPSGHATTLEVDEEPDRTETAEPVQVYRRHTQDVESSTPWLAIGGWLMGAAAFGAISAWLVLLLVRRRQA